MYYIHTSLDKYRRQVTSYQFTGFQPKEFEKRYGFHEILDFGILNK